MANLFPPANFRSHDLPIERRTREIENHYYLLSIAESQSEQLASYREHERSRIELAERYLEQVSEQSQDLQELRQEVSEQLRLVGSDLSIINQTLNENLSAIQSSIHTGFAHIASELMQQRLVLSRISETLRQPFHTQVLELRKEADKWLNSGMRNQGETASDDLDDAARLLKEVTNNPIGNQDYSAWFHIGWLHWKHRPSLEDAEKAFYRSARLSAHEKNAWHVLALRHLAELRYLRSNKLGAWEAIQQALAISRSPEILFDAARYAAVIGAHEQSVTLLSECIDKYSITIVTMFSDTDLATLRPQLHALHHIKLNQLREVARETRSYLIQDIECIRTISNDINSPLLSDSSQEESNKALERYEKAQNRDFLSILGSEDSMTMCRIKIRGESLDAFRAGVEAAKKTIEALKQGIWQADNAYKSGMEHSKQVDTSGTQWGEIVSIFLICSVITVVVAVGGYFANANVLNDVLCVSSGMFIVGIVISIAITASLIQKRLRVVNEAKNQRKAAYVHRNMALRLTEDKDRSEAHFPLLLAAQSRIMNEFKSRDVKHKSGPENWATTNQGAMS